MLYRISVCTSQETHYVSATETSQVSVYCENHTEHTDTVRTSQETHYVSATETSQVSVYCENHTEHTNTVRNKLRRTAETSQVSVYCENYTEHTNTVRTSHETYYAALQRQVKSLFTVRTIRNTKMHSVAEM
jgi:translation initiation factor IF-1